MSAEPRNAAKWAPLARQTRGARFNPCRTARRLITEVSEPDEFEGQIERVFATGAGEITGGDILDLRGQKTLFKKADILAVE